MLRTLRIQNYALIDDVEIEFGDGFNVLTGETGAGKSIVVGALNLVLGARASSEAVRKGAKSAKVDAVFYVPEPAQRLRHLLDEHAIDLEDGELLVSRVVSAEGRSKAYAGGGLVSVSVLAAIGDELVDLHGQHDHQSLLRGDRQLELLDAYAGNNEAVDALAEQVRKLRQMESHLAELEKDDRERTRRLEFMRYELDEIDKAELRPGEDEELRSQRDLMSNAEQIQGVAAKAVGALVENEDPAAVSDVLGRISRDLEAFSPVDERFRGLLERIDATQSEIDAVAGEIRSIAESIDYDPETLETVNSRLTAIQGLKKKYGETIEAVLAYADGLRQELSDFENRDERCAAVRKEAEELRSAIMADAGKLAKQRRRAAKELERDVSVALQDLGMKGARFSVKLETVDLTVRGTDEAAFLLAANAGEDLKPLKSVASGGEISRIMLAIKTVFAQADAIPTLIFDEIDTGVGGAVATQVAAKMTGLAASHQTIAITHLAQIAAAGRVHFSVTKGTEEGVTTTHVVRLENDARVREIARLLDGTVTDLSLQHAKSLLAPDAPSNPEKRRGTA